MKCWKVIYFLSCFSHISSLAKNGPVITPRRALGSRWRYWINDEREIVKLRWPRDYETTTDKFVEQITTTEDPTETTTLNGEESITEIPKIEDILIVSSDFEVIEENDIPVIDFNDKETKERISPGVQALETLEKDILPVANIRASNLLLPINVTESQEADSKILLPESSEDSNNLKILLPPGNSVETSDPNIKILRPPSKSEEQGDPNLKILLPPGSSVENSNLKILRPPSEDDEDDDTLRDLPGYESNSRVPQSCFETFSETKIDISKRPSGNCTFIFKKQSSSICRLNIQFNRRLQQSGELCAGSLKIGNATICNARQGSLREFNFTGEMIPLVLTVPSDNNSTFNLTVRQIDCTNDDTLINSQIRARQEIDTCNNIYNAREFVVQSPNYPFRYPANTDCVTTIFPADSNICSLELRFDEFDVEPSEVIDECAKDYLEISGVGDKVTEPVRYCGGFTGIRVVEMNNLKRLTFHSDSNNITGVGYSIFIRQISCEFPQTVRPRTSEGTTVRPPFNSSEVPTLSTSTVRPPFSTTPTTCSQSLLASPPKLISSPGYPTFYPPDLQCVYEFVFTRSDICFLQISYVTFDVEPSLGCRKDYLEVNGERNCGVKDGTFIYPVDLGSSTAKITFVSDSEVNSIRQGFQIKVAQVQCDERPDPGLPTYGPPSTSRPPFNTNTPGRPPYIGTTSGPSYLPPYNPPSYLPPSQHIPSYNPPSYLPPNPSIPSYKPTPTSNPTTNRPPFNTQPFRTNRPPFVSTSTNRPPFISTPITSQRPPFSSTQAPSYNPPSQSYGRPSYRPRKPNYRPPKTPNIFEQIFKAKVDFINGFFSLFKKPQQISHTRPGYGAPPRPSYGAPSHKPPSQSYGAPRVGSEPSEDEYKVGCNTTSKATHLVIQSPNYPDNYGDGMTCSYTILPNNEEICGLKLMIDDFIVEESYGCLADHLLIDSILTGGRTATDKRLCGQQSGSEITLTTRSSLAEPEIAKTTPWTLRFKTDFAGNTRGFSMRAVQIPCNTNEV